jgi:molybdate transport system regulatory protein
MAKTSKSSPRPASPSQPISTFLPLSTIGLNGRLWIEIGGERFFGPGPLQLLEYIEETGSINQAAKKMEMSYKKAWSIINNLNTSALRPLVLTATGGQKGGGSTISPEAKALITYYRDLHQRFKQFLQAETLRITK